MQKPGGDYLLVLRFYALRSLLCGFGTEGPW